MAESPQISEAAAAATGTVESRADALGAYAATSGPMALDTVDRLIITLLHENARPAMRVQRHRLARADPGLEHAQGLVLEQEAVETRCGHQRNHQEQQKRRTDAL